MGLPIAPILIGAGIGAVGGAVTGKNPFETALLGAALGTGAGALGAGGAAAGAGTAASLAPEAGAAALGSIGSSAGTAEALGAGTLGATEAAPLAFAPIAEPTIGGSLLATDAAIPTAADIGAGFGTDQISQMIAQDPSLLDKVKPYLSANNVMGAANMAMSYKPTQRPTPQGGHVSQGQAPQGGLGAGGVEGLLAELQKQRQTQRQPISLLVG